MCCFFFVLFCINLLANSILAHETFYFVCWALPSPLDFINAYTLIYLIAIFFPQLLSHSLIISISLFHRRKCQLKVSQLVELWISSWNIYRFAKAWLLRLIFCQVFFPQYSWLLMFILEFFTNNSKLLDLCMLNFQSIWLPDAVVSPFNYYYSQIYVVFIVVN